MAQVPVPGVAQASISGTKDSQPWTCVSHWKFDNSTAPWTVGQIQALADLLSSNWATYANPHCGTEVIMNSVSTVDIGSFAPVVGSNTVSHTGSGGVGIANSATCTLISCRIPARYRGGHPRMYLPWGLLADNLTGFEWSPTYVTQSAAAWANIVQAVRTGIPPVGGNQVSQVSVAYTYQYSDDPIHHKWLKTRTGLKQVYVIQSYITNPTFGTQRRRLTQG